MKLMNCRDPYEDELFFGYVCDLFRMNGFLYLSDIEQILGVRLSVCCQKNIARICSVIENRMFPDLPHTLQMTPLGCLMDNRPDGKAALIAECMIQPTNPAFSGVHIPGKKEIKICRSCWENDRKRYGEGYLHLDHNLPGVSVCLKHGEALVGRPEPGKRSVMSEWDLRGFKETEVDDMDSALEFAENQIASNDKNLDKLQSAACPDCGRVYPSHPHSEKTGCGCPFCKDKIAPEEIIKRRLKTRFGDEYRLEGKVQNLRTMKVIHVPCGELRKEPEYLIYGEPEACMGCLKLTPELLQKRYDPDKSEWVFLESPEEDLKRKRIKIRHLTCNKEFYAFSPVWSSKGAYCPYCDNPQKRIDISETDDEYEIVGEYKNNRETVSFLHRKCGFVYESSKTSFLLGHKCPLCSVRLASHDVEDAVSDCAPGWRVIKSVKRGCVVPVDPDGNAMPEMTYREVIQDLKRDVPEIFTDRVKKYEEPRSLRKMVYDNVLQETERKGYWTFADGLDGEEVSRIRHNLVQDVCNAGYIERIDKGKYRAVIRRDA